MYLYYLCSSTTPPGSLDLLIIPVLAICIYNWIGVNISKVISTCFRILFIMLVCTLAMATPATQPALRFPKACQIALCPHTKLASSLKPWVKLSCSMQIKCSRPVSWCSYTSPFLSFHATVRKGHSYLPALLCCQRSDCCPCPPIMLCCKLKSSSESTCIHFTIYQIVYLYCWNVWDVMDLHVHCYE